MKEWLKDLIYGRRDFEQDHWACLGLFLSVIGSFILMIISFISL